MCAARPLPLRGLAARIEQFLRCEDANVSGLYRAFNAQLLLLGFELGKAGLLCKNTAGFSEFSAGDDGLLQEETLLAAVDGAAADFIPYVADGRIGIKAGLLSARLRGADFGMSP